MQVINIILESLAEIFKKYSCCKILNCLDFLREFNYLPRNCPDSLKMNIIQRVLATGNHGFAFKVYKTLFDVKHLDHRLYNNETKIHIDRFFDVLGTVINPYKKHALGTHSSTSSESDLHERSKSKDCFTSGGNQNYYWNEIIKKNKVNPAAIVQRLKSAELTANDLQLIFDSFQSLKDGAKVYLNVIQLCPGNTYYK